MISNNHVLFTMTSEFHRSSQDIEVHQTSLVGFETSLAIFYLAKSLPKKNTKIQPNGVKKSWDLVEIYNIVENKSNKNLLNHTTSPKLAGCDLKTNFVSSTQKTVSSDSKKNPKPIQMSSKNYETWCTC